MRGAVTAAIATALWLWLGSFFDEAQARSGGPLAKRCPCSRLLDLCPNRSTSSFQRLSSLTLSARLDMTYEVVHKEAQDESIVWAMGLWKKTGTYRERPRVNFDGRYLLLLMSDEQYIFSSTLPVLNAAENSHFVVSQLDHQWISHTDEQDIETAITVPTRNLTFNTLIYFVFFNYTLDYHSSVEAEVALCDTVHLSSSTTALDILGRVAADQKMPFRWRERYELFDEDRLDFKLKAVIAEDEFVYKTDFWELLKWGAVQYVFAFITVNYFTNSFLNCLFRNQVIEVVPCCEALQGNLK
ncbi:unnamed protein product [Nippostrongylus brasiliensis]|uniref:Transmembrane protein 231 n=1 Tax=Nippostrongylus brasiliensis TaxID=27835 RepID=A0A0N4XDJ9_NIPBR|nr:unnamed protein product [Nippostrongylus brasiliensis]